MARYTQWPDLGEGHQIEGNILVGVKLQRPTVKDPRLIVGIILVIASIVGVSMVVERANNTTAVYQVREPIVPGAKLDEAHIEIVQVNLGAAEQHYIPASQSLADHVALATIETGELIAQSAVSPAHQTDQRPVPISVDRSLAALLAKGDYVDVWWQEEESTEPELVTSRAVIWYSPGSNTGMGASMVPVYIVVSAEQVPTILGFQQSPGVLSVLPVVGATDE